MKNTLLLAILLSMFFNSYSQDFIRGSSLTKRKLKIQLYNDSIRLCATKKYKVRILDNKKTFTYENNLFYVDTDSIPDYRNLIEFIKKNYVIPSSSPTIMPVYDIEVMADSSGRIVAIGLSSDWSECGMNFGEPYITELIRVLKMTNSILIPPAKIGNKTVNSFSIFRFNYYDYFD